MNDDPREGNELPPFDCPTMRVIAMPKEANYNGDIFGGWTLAQIDLAGAIVAGERAQGRLATVAVESAHLRKPVLIGDVVSFYATIAKSGNTSITVDVEVFSSRVDGTVTKTSSATMVYVAIDDDGRPRRLPPASG